MTTRRTSSFSHVTSTRTRTSTGTMPRSSMYSTYPVYLWLAFFLLVLALDAGGSGFRAEEEFWGRAAVEEEVRTATATSGGGAGGGAVRGARAGGGGCTGCGLGLVAGAGAGTARGSNTVVLLDADGDGRVEAAVGVHGLNGSVDLFESPAANARYLFQRAISVERNILALASADLNADGAPDLFIGAAEVSGAVPGNSSVWLGAGDGTFVDLGLPFSAKGLTTGVAICDFDGNNYPDIFTAEVAPRNNLFLNLGVSPWFNASQASYSTPDDSFSEPSDVACGDLNGDNKPDVVFANDQAPSVVWFNSGNGTMFNFSQLLNTTSCQAVALADLDRDADLDIVFAAYDAENVVFLNSGGIFSLGTKFTPSDRTTALAIGDIDQDNFPDIYFVNDHSSDKLWWNMGNGKDFEDSGLEHGATVSGSDVVLADLNSDLRLDAMVTSIENDTGILINTCQCIVGGPPFQSEPKPDLFLSVEFEGNTPNHRLTPYDRCGNERDDLAVNIHFTRLVEVTPEGTELKVLDYDASSYSIIATTNGTVQGFDFYTFINSSDTEFEFSLFAQAVTQLFGNVSFAIEGSSSKFTVQFNHWMFANPANNLRLEVSIASADGPFLSRRVEAVPSQGLKRHTLFTARSAVEISLLDFCILDMTEQIPVTANFSTDNSRLSLTFPAFSTVLAYDPNLRILLSDSGDCGDGDGNDAVVIGVVVSVSVAAAVVLLVLAGLGIAIAVRRVRGAKNSTNGVVIFDNEDAGDGL